MNMSIDLARDGRSKRACRRRTALVMRAGFNIMTIRLLVILPEGWTRQTHFWI
jgi:hypothetical protein